MINREDRRRKKGQLLNLKHRKRALMKNRLLWRMKSLKLKGRPKNQKVVINLKEAKKVHKKDQDHRKDLKKQRNQ